MPGWTLTDVTVRGRLRGVSAAVGSGVTRVVGPSGAGKTTLLDVLCGEVAPDGGRVDGGGGFTLWCGCGQGLWPHLTAVGQIEAVGGDRAWLQRLGLAGRSDVRPAELSLGERSRLELARGLAAKPETLVLDEPLTHVDAAAAKAGWDALREFAAGGGTVVVATHDAAAGRLGGGVIRLSAGCVVEDAAS